VKRILLWFLILTVVSSMSLMSIGCKEEAAEEAVEEISEETTEEVSAETESSGDVEEVVYKQSPVFDEQDLPPLEERLPEEPKIVNEMPESQLDYQIGNYGGVLRTVTATVGWDVNVWAMLKEPLLNTPGILGEEITGNVLKGYEISEDQKEFTFYMREGMKWSDGEPLTTEDVDFAINDVLFNTDITPVFPDWLKSGGNADGNPVVFEVIDDYTFKMTFDEPYGGLLIRMSIKSWIGHNDLIKPKHYLRQFHTEYTPLEELEPIIEENGLGSGDWVSLFTLKDVASGEETQESAVGFPTLSAWTMTEVDGNTTIYERNPYYFKVDEEGNQLPYIDEIKSELVQDNESITLKMLSGEVDYDGFQGSLMNVPLYQENTEGNDFKVIMADYHVSPADLYINLSYEDPVWQEVASDIRFRKAINYAINREEILDAVYYNFGSPSEILGNTYDTGKANELLDEMGMEEGADGYRLSPGGEKFTVPIEFCERASDMAPVAELIAAMLDEVGIRTTVKNISFSLWDERQLANDLIATVQWTEIIWYNLGEWAMNTFAREWYYWWLTGGSEGVEPPEEAKELFSLLDEVSVSNPEVGIQKFEEVKKNVGDNVWILQILGTVKQPIIANAKLGNVEPKDSAWAIAITFSGETFFFEE